MRVFWDKKIANEVDADSLGDEWKGYRLKITGGNDKQGFPMMQGVLVNNRVRLLLDKNSKCYRPRRPGERRRKSIRGCIVGPDLAVLSLIITKKGEADIPGLNEELPQRLGPKRASKIRKLFNLTRKDDVRKYVVRRKLAGKPETHKGKAPKIQRLITPAVIHRRKKRVSLQKQSREKSRKEANDYAKLLAKRRKAARDKRQALISKRRSSVRRDSEKKAEEGAPATTTAKAPAVATAGGAKGKAKKDTGAHPTTHKKTEGQKGGAAKGKQTGAQGGQQKQPAGKEGQAKTAPQGGKKGGKQSGGKKEGGGKKGGK